MVVVNTLQQNVTSGPQDYPIYIGFMKAADILKIAGVPAFLKTTSHDLIAGNVLSTPIREWQRPMDPNRVQGIATLFDNTGEMMPNPVLLAENVAGTSPSITVTAKVAPGGSLTGTFDVEFQEPDALQDHPLWILDGQHRINGLSKSAQDGNMVPVVFLLNAGGSFYKATHLAKLFAQVTTTAQKLDDLHNEWLTFAFRLGEYATTAPDGQAQIESMKCVAEICKTPAFGTVANPFLNNVRFNTHQPVSPAPGGFTYNCIELKNLILKFYYGESVTSNHLPPVVVAEQFILAHKALRLSVSNASQSVFFGTGTFNQKIMQDAFVAGVLTHLRINGIPNDWLSELQTLAFHTTNWNFSWVVSLNGEDGTNSKKLAFDVMTAALRLRKLPVPGSNSIADILKGNNAQLDMEFSKLNITGRAMTAGRMSQTLRSGNVTSANINPAVHIKIRNQSINIAKLTVTDRQSPPGSLVKYPKMIKGLVLNLSQHRSPLELFLEMKHYGGNTSVAKIDVTW